MPRRLRLLQKAARPRGGALQPIVTGEAIDAAMDGVMDGVTLAVASFTSLGAKPLVVDLVAHRAKVRADR